MDVETSNALIGGLFLKVGLMLFGVFISAVLLKLLFKRLKAAVKRHGWPLVTLFLVCSAWATYTAFPTSEEKDEYRQSQNEQTEINSAWAGIYGVDGTVTFDGATSIAGSAQAGVASTEGDSAQMDAQAPATTNEVVDALSTYELTAEDFARGFVLTCVGTNEVHNFIPYGNSIVCADWLAHGAAEDWIYLRDERWEMGGEKLRIHSDGVVKAFKGSDSLYAASGYYPFKTVLGIVPEANWHLLGNGEWGTGNWGGSLFWHEVTSLNTLKLTWQNVLYNRTTETPVSFEIEYDEKGDFIYRYDFTSVRNKIASGEWGENWASNVVIGVIGDDAPHSFFIDTSSTSLLLCDSALKTNVITALKTATLSSLTFQHLEHDDAPGSDRDGDGLTLEEELFVYHTDPYSADTDLDGLSDYDEVVVYGTDPHDVYSANGNYIDGLAVKLGRLDPFSYPEGSTNTVLEHVFYSGTTNGVFAYPQSSDSVGVLKVMVTGAGTGRLVVGEAVVPLVPPPMTRSLAQTNTLLLAVGKGVKKSIWFTKPDELQVSIDSADLLIGEIPSLLCPKGWIAFPHTDATVPCIHDFCSKGRTVTLVHGEEFEGLTASWSSDENDVVITNVAPVSAEIYGRFKKDQTREISYTVNHPDQLNQVEAKFTQMLRFCPPFSEDDEPPEELPEEDTDEKYRNCMCDENTPCVCSPDEWCFCYSPTCRCNENRSPTITDNEDDQTVCTNILESLPPLSDVLYLYRDNSRTFALPVPEGEPRRCCPCPEHSKSNYVSMTLYTSRLAVKDAVGQDFNISYEPCDITVSGVSPSRAFRDSTVNFITNGVSYKRIDYTVLGVDIARPEGEVSVERYNELSSELGYPFEICTNFENAVSLLLRTDVKLETGYVKISLEDATGDIKLWLPSWYDNDGTWHDYEVLLDSQAKCVRYMSMSKWRGILRRYWSDRELEVKVTSATPSSCKLKLEYIASDGSHSIHDFVEQRITSVMPLILVDYNRDMVVDASDAIDKSNNRFFYFWANDDVWKGDNAFAAYEEHDFSLLPIKLSSNGKDENVNGRNDLVNLCPMGVSLSSLYSKWGHERLRYEVTTYHPYDIRFVPIKTKSSELNKIVSEDQETVFGELLHSAKLLNTLDAKGRNIGFSFPFSFLSLGLSVDRVLAVEFVTPGIRNIAVRVVDKNDGTVLFKSTFDVTVLDVHDMYRWLNFENACNETVPSKYNDKLSVSWPEAEESNRNIVFVHGYNVHPSEAWAWSQAVFKRLWWNGMDAMFTAVLWRGNETQMWVPGKNCYATINYHQNVLNAFRTAKDFALRVNQLPGERKYIIAHSLGNMLVSAARQDHGLLYEKYFMLNAAVPVEAYDADSGVTELSKFTMTPKNWRPYQDRVRSTHWYELFSSSPNDVRKTLTWKGRFKDVDKAVNFFSSMDEVVANGNDEVDELVSRNYAWYNQEHAKGFYLVSLSPQAGWRFNDDYFKSEYEGYWENGAPVYRNRYYTPEEASQILSADLKIKPFFRDFKAKQIYGEEGSSFLEDHDEVCWSVLSHGIPSESFAAGANPILKWDNDVVITDGIAMNESDEMIRNIDMATQCNPSGRSVRPVKWIHSYFIGNSLMETRKLYEEIIKIVNE